MSVHAVPPSMMPYYFHLDQLPPHTLLYTNGTYSQPNNTSRSHPSSTLLALPTPHLVLLSLRPLIAFPVLARITFLPFIITGSWRLIFWLCFHFGNGCKLSGLV